MVSISSTRVSRLGSVLGVQMLCDLLRRNGHDPAGFLSGAGISTNVFSQPGAVISRRQQREFDLLFAAATRDRPEIWVESGRRLSYVAGGEFGMATITSPTLRHLRHLTEARGVGLGRYPSAAKGHSVGVTVSFEDDFPPGTPGFQFHVVRAAIAGVRLYDELWGSKFPFSLIEMPAEVAAYDLASHIHHPIRYGYAPLRFLWSREVDETALPKGDEVLHRHYVSLLSDAHRQRSIDLTVDIDEQVKAILSQMSDSTPGIDEVAAELRITARTLQRRLAERGTAFRTLLETSRLERAELQLRTSDALIGEIAASVGFTTKSSFSHAFHRWTGQSPSAYRNSHRNGDISHAA